MTGWPGEITDFDVVLRLIMATMMGGAVGLDRELRGKPAGLRTHALVSLGSALVTVAAIRFVSPEHVDHGAITRAIQGIIAGVGFLGGGVILKAEGRDDVRGLTTAASIWLVASLGISCGGGYWVASIVGAALALLVLIVGTAVEAYVHRQFRTRKHDAYTQPPPGLPED
jgi:putative Mg2+ transporter-C (MgtC) family protein